MRGVGGSRERGAFCLDYFSFFFSLKQTCYNTRFNLYRYQINISGIKKPGFKCQEYSKLSSFKVGLYLN